MDRRPLGHTGLTVSSLGLGCVTFGREIDAAAAFAVLDRARESGITLLDTAAAYHHGASERVLGDWMADRACRDAFVVASKVAVPLTRARVIASAEDSLRRLRVEAIDLFQLHSWDPGTPVEETLEALGTLRTAGKIRHAGCSNWSAAQLQAAHPALATIQPPYNLVQRGIESDLLPFAQVAGVGVLTYSPLAAGFLTGKYRRGGEVPGGTRFDVIPGHQPLYFTERGWAVVEGLRALADRERRPLADLALGWVTARPGVTSVLIGARHPGHIDQALAALRQPLPLTLIDELSAL
jgi:1-deoxyxylulose-5-phosphate synthase